MSSLNDYDNWSASILLSRSDSDLSLLSSSGSATLKKMKERWLRISIVANSFMCMQNTG